MHNKITQFKGSVAVGVIGALCAIISAGLLTILWYKIVPDIKQNTSTLTVVKADVKSLQDKLDELKATEKVTDRMAPSVGIIDMAFPENEQIPELLVSTSAMGLASGLQELSDLNLGTSTDAATSGYATSTVSLTGTAEYQPILNFLDSLYSNIRTMDIRSVTLSPKESSDDTENSQPTGALSFTLDGNVYSQAPPKALPASNASTAPTTTQTTTPPTTPANAQ